MAGQDLLPEDAGDAVRNVAGSQPPDPNKWNDVATKITKSERAAFDLAKSLGTVTPEMQRAIDITKKGGETMAAVMGTITTNVKQATKSLEEMSKTVEKGSDTAVKSHKKHKEAIADVTNEYKKASSQSSPIQALSSTISTGMSSMEGGIGAVVGGVSAMTMELSRMIPGLMAFAGAAAFVTEVLSTLFGEVSQLASYSKFSGGNVSVFQDYLDLAKGTGAETHQGTDSIVKFGRSFYTLGGDISNANAQLMNLQKSAGNFMYFFHADEDTAAHFFNDMAHEGSEADSVLSALYERMKLTRGTEEDVLAAVKDGRVAWREFGATTGRSMSNFQMDLLTTRALFKGMNVDVEKMGASLNFVFGGDRVTQIRNAGFQAAVLGKTFAETYTAKMMNPAEALNNNIATPLIYLQRMMGDRAFMMSDQFASINDASNAALQKSAIIENMKKQNMWMPNEENFMASFMATKAKNPGLTIPQWMSGSELHGVAGGSYKEALAKNQALTPLDSIKETLKLFFESFANVFLPKFVGLCNWIRSGGFNGGKWDEMGLSDTGWVMGDNSKQSQDALAAAASVRGTSKDPYKGLGPGTKAPKNFKNWWTWFQYQHGGTPAGMDEPLTVGGGVSTEPMLGVPMGAPISATFGALTSEQLMNAAMIVRVGKAHHASDQTIKAMLAGAMAEGHLWSDPIKHHVGNGDGGTSFGTFQMHIGGALDKHSRAEAENAGIAAELMYGRYASNTIPGMSLGDIAIGAEQPAFGARAAYKRSIDAYYSKTAEELLRKINDQLQQLNHTTKKDHEINQAAYVTGKTGSQIAMLNSSGGNVI